LLFLWFTVLCCPLWRIKIYIIILFLTVV